MADLQDSSRLIGGAGLAGRLCAVSLPGESGLISWAELTCGSSLTGTSCAISTPGGSALISQAELTCRSSLTGRAYVMCPPGVRGPVRRVGLIGGDAAIELFSQGGA